MTLSIYRNGVVVESVTIDDTAKLSQSFMGGNYLNVPLTVTRKLDVLPLDYVFFEGERYTLYDEPESRVFDGMIDYTLIFHAPYFELYNKRYRNLGDLEFDYSGDLVDFLNVLIESMGEESGFTLGTVESIGWQTITFSNKSCYGALVDICKAFEAEFVVSGKEISAGKSLAADTAYTFEYGRGKGLYELKREEIGNSSVVTVLHVFGGTTNVPAGYHVGGKYGRLALPAPLTQNVDIYGVREDEVTFDEIYPRLKDKGLLAVTVPEDIASAAYWRVKLDIDFDLSKCVQPGLTAQLQFRSGELMGITFDLLAGSFDNTTKEISIIVKEEGDARYPSLTRQPKVGDQFVLLNIDMDDSYLTAAQEELQQKGQEYLDKVSSTQWLYKLTIDPHEYGRRGYVISVGDKIRVKDSRLGFDAKIRVSERTVQLTDPRNIELTISDEVLYSSDERLNHEVSGNSEQVSIHSDDIRAQYLMLKYNEQVLKQIIAAVEPILDVIYYDPDLDAVVTRKDFLSQKGISAYGLGSTSGSGVSGSLGELVNVGQWADAVPTVDRVMVQLAGATHWSAKPLADLVGLDTTALAQYLTANSYLKASDISSYLTWANLSGKPTVYPTSWELVVGRPTKLSDLTDDVVAGNYLPKPTWDAVFEVVTVDGTPALKVKYDILGLKGITAYAEGSLSGGFSGALVDLVDVAVTNLASGDILKYNGTHFVNVPVSSIAGASSWDQITGKPEYYPTRWADVSGAPTSLPASDVYPWAKAASKPTYTAAEVGALALSGGTLTGNVITIGSFILANSGAYPQLTFRATADNSERLLFRHGNDLKWRYNGTNDGIIYHSGNFNPSSKLDKSVWDEAFELKTVNGVRVISAKLDFLSVAGISAYATGPSSGGGGGGLDYDLLKQALTGAITPDGYPFTISASFLGAIGNTYLPLSGGTLTNTGNSAPLIITGSSLQACTKYMMNGSTVSGYFGVVAQGLNGAFMQYANGTISPSLIINNDAAPRFINTAGTQFALYHSGNFNPDRKFGLSDIISDLNNAPLNAVFSTNGTPANAPLENAYFQGFTFAMDNNPGFKRQWAFKDKKIWFRNLHAGSWSAWTDVIPLDNYLPLSGGSITGGLGVSGYLTAGSLKINETGSVYPQILFTGNNGNSSLLFVNAISRELVFRPADGVANDGIVYHSKNLTKLSQLTNDVVPSWAMATTNHYLPYDDTRNTNYAPYNSNIPKGLTTVHLKTPGIDGLTDGSTYHSSIYITPWISASGGPAHNIAFTDSGNMWMRHGTTSWSEWVKVYHSGNFNPDNYLPLSGGKMITGDFQFKDGVAVRDAAGRSVVGLLDVAGDGVCVAVGNSAKKTRIVTPNDTPVYRNDGKGAYRIYDSSNSNLSTVDWSANNLNAAANLDVAGQAYVSGWLRSRGNVGWYSQDYGGGIYMTDSTWVRVYGSKGLMIDTGHIGMGQLQITNSGEASIGFRSPSSSSGDWCLGKGVSTIGSGFGLYNAVTNRVAFQIASATDAASFASSITAAGTIVSMSTVESRGNNSTGILPQMMWHIPGVTYARIRMASNGTLHVINGASEAYHSLYAQSFVAAGNVTAADTVTATKLVLGGITIDVYNGALRVNGNLVATGGVTSLATA